MSVPSPWLYVPIWIWSLPCLALTYRRKVPVTGAMCWRRRFAVFAAITRRVCSREHPGPELLLLFWTQSLPWGQVLLSPGNPHALGWETNNSCCKLLGSWGCLLHNIIWREWLIGISFKRRSYHTCCFLVKLSWIPSLETYGQKIEMGQKNMYFGKCFINTRYNLLKRSH